MRLKNGQHLWSSMVSTYWCSHQLNPRLQRQTAWTCLWKLLPWPRNASPTPNQNQTGTQKLPGSACSAVKRSAGFISKSFLMSCLASSDTCVVTYSAWVWLCLAARWGKKHLEKNLKREMSDTIWHHHFIYFQLATHSRIAVARMRLMPVLLWKGEMSPDTGHGTFVAGHEGLHRSRLRTMARTCGSVSAKKGG